MVAPLLFSFGRLGVGLTVRLAVRGLSEVLRDTEREIKQRRFAAAVALTRTVQEIERRIPREVESVLDRPSWFTTTGTYTIPATKDRLTAVVGFKDRQSDYLHYQVEGGRRAPKRRGLRLPSVVELDAQGNLPPGTIKRLVAAARSGRRIGGKTARRLGIAQRSEIFYGKPRGGKDRPVGLYSRRNASGHRSLVPLIVFPSQSAQYWPRFHFYKWAERQAAEIFPRKFEQALEWALRTAR